MKTHRYTFDIQVYETVEAETPNIARSKIHEILASCGFPWEDIEIEVEEDWE